MRVAVAANGMDLDAQLSPIFGRCPQFVFVDTESMQFEALANPAGGARGGAGIQASQFIIQQGAKAVVAGNLGPNAAAVLKSAGLVTYIADQGTVKEAVEALKSGQLSPASDPTVAADFGKQGLARGQGRNGRFVR